MAAPLNDSPVCVTTFTTPKNALVPYSDEAGPRIISTRSIDRHIEAELAANRGLVVHVVVDSMPVDEQEDPGVVVAGLGKPAGANVAVIAVVVDIEATHATQHVGKRAVAVAGNVIRSDDGDGSRRLGDRLHPLGCPEDTLHLDLHQVREAEIRQLRGLCASDRWRCNRHNHDENK